jgi:phage I-like protein
VSPQPIEIFRPGRHRAMSGQTITFSEGDLAASAAAYDTALHEAPLCVGHPAHDAPAYGWVSALRFADGSLAAAPHQVDAAFAELVKAGRFKKISAAFYAPGAAGNPKPGVYYLRHVAFLGAQPPSVKGLKPVQFAADDDGIVVFGDWSDRLMVRLLRGLRDHLISRDGQDAADRALPASDLDALADDAAQPDCPDEGDSMTGSPAYAERERELAARQRQLEERERALQGRETQQQQRDAAFAEEERTRRQARNIAAIEGLVRNGQVIPAERALLLNFLERLEGGEKMVIAFGEEGEEKEVTAAQAFRTWLGLLPQRWSFAEVAGTEVERGPRRRARPFAVPKGAGLQVDPAQLDLRDRALAYAEQHKIDFVDAVKALEGAEA